MHAHESKIHAVATSSPIQAAMATPEYKSISRLMASSGLDAEIAKGGVISIAEVDKALSSLNLSSVQRIQLKTTLSRLNLVR